MKIYIASSWKNQHAVEMLTDILRGKGHTVLSFVENNRNEGNGPWNPESEGKPINFEEWIKTEQAAKSLRYDVNGAAGSELVIYIGPSGTDAWAKVGIAWASEVQIYGLWAKGEQSGLMRMLVEKWFTDYRELVRAVSDIVEIDQ